MYEKYTHTERTVIERGHRDETMTIKDMLIGCYIAASMMGAAVVAVVSGLVAALGFGLLALLGLVGLLLIASVPSDAPRHDVQTQRIESDGFDDEEETTLAVRRWEVQP